MAIDIKLLKKHGVSAESYKKIFTKPYDELPPKVKRLTDLIRSRINDGFTLNLSEWRAYHAIDLAYEVPFAQTTPAIIQHIASKNMKPAEILQVLEEYGLSEDEMFLRVQGEDGTTQRRLNLPVFFQIYIPLVKAYVAVRWAKLFNERNVNPIMEYKPLKSTERNQVLCEVITDVVNTISTWYGYSAVLRQAICQALKYGQVLAMTREEWHYDKQGQLNEDGTESEYTVREGLRYLLPDPARFFYDLRFSPTSINTDTGCEFAGGWHVLSYGEVLDQQKYWNRKNIFCGTNWFMNPLAGNYFEEIYPCKMKAFPVSCAEPPKREDKAAWYTSDDRDKAVFVTEYFMKLVPKDWGLGKYELSEKTSKEVLTDTYNRAVWHRFTVAGDNTILWCEPCAYNPLWFIGVDYDDSASRQSSFALECAPWQYHLGNILSQMLLTAKQNLASTVFYDNQQIDKADIDQLKNMGEARYRSRQFVGYDSLKNRVAGLNASAAFQKVDFGNTSIQELIQVIPTIFTIMERVLQISASEAGAQGTHQQSKFELQQIGGGSNNRVILSGSFIDEGIDAWKRQNVDAAIAYLDPTFEAQVNADTSDIEKILDELGFTVKHTGKEKLLITGNKTKLRLEQFARSAVGADKQPDAETAKVIFTLVQTISAQEQLRDAIGVDNLLVLLNFASELAGAPRGMRIRKSKNGKPTQVPQNVVDAISQAQKATMEAVDKQLGQPVAQEVAKIQGEVQQVQAALQQLQGIYQLAQQITSADQIKSKEAQAKMQIRQAEFQAEEARKNEELKAKLQRDAAESQAKLAIKATETAAKVELDKRAAAAKAGNTPASQ